MLSQISSSSSSPQVLERKRATWHVLTFKGLIRRAYWLDSWEGDDSRPTILLSMDGPESHFNSDLIACGATGIEQKLI